MGIVIRKTRLKPVLGCIHCIHAKVSRHNNFISVQCDDNVNANAYGTCNGFKFDPTKLPYIFDFYNHDGGKNCYGDTYVFADEVSPEALQKIIDAETARRKANDDLREKKRLKNAIEEAARESEYIDALIAVREKFKGDPLKLVEALDDVREKYHPDTSAIDDF